MSLAVQLSRLEFATFPVGPMKTLCIQALGEIVGPLSAATAGCADASSPATPSVTMPAQAAAVRRHFGIMVFI
jgi:hypothetical protein